MAGKLGGKQAARLARQPATAKNEQKMCRQQKQRQVLYSLNMPSNEERREKERQRKKESRRRASEAQSERERAKESSRKETEL